MIKLLYCEIFGYSCDFAYFKVVEWVSDSNFVVKKTAYLFISICFPRDLDMLNLVINQINVDIQKTRNVNALYAGEDACRSIVTESVIPIFLKSITYLIKHEEYIYNYILLLL